MDDRIEECCEVMHDAYERAAVGAGWETQAESRKPWADVPEANKATMRAAVGALLEHLERGGEARRSSDPTVTVTLSDFLLARIAEDESNNGCLGEGEYSTCWKRSERIEAECAAKRRIVALAEEWPVLVETPLLVRLEGGDDLDSMAFWASQQIAWLTTQEYRKRFGDEPPSSTVLRALALPYADHPDYDEAWRR